MKSKCKNWIQWGIAFCIGAFIANGICFVFFRSPAVYRRDDGAIKTVFYPEAYYINLVEGYGVGSIDKNGYVNAYSELASSGYVLVLGNSQTKALQVPEDKKYVSILNEKILSANNLESKGNMVYSMSVGGADFGELAQGFEAALGEFPNCEAVIIQVSNGQIPDNVWEQVSKQRKFDNLQTANEVFHESGRIWETVYTAENLCPLVFFLYDKSIFTTMEMPFQNAFIAKAQENEDNLQGQLLQSLCYLKERYSKKIIILNLPSVFLQESGEIVISDRGQADYEQACAQAGVIWLDMSDAFQKLYLEEHKLPYGFSNTYPGYGHLNEDGHRVVAEELFYILNENYR